MDELASRCQGQHSGFGRTMRSMKVLPEKISPYEVTREIHLMNGIFDDGL